MAKARLTCRHAHGDCFLGLRSCAMVVNKQWPPTLPVATPVYANPFFSQKYDHHQIWCWLSCWTWRKHRSGANNIEGIELCQSSFAMADEIPPERSQEELETRHEQVSFLHIIGFFHVFFSNPPEESGTLDLWLLNVERKQEGLHMSCIYRNLKVLF